MREIWKIFLNDNGTGSIENSFHFFMRSLRFDYLNTIGQPRSDDRLVAVQECFSKFVTNFQNSYALCEFVMINKKLITFRGHCPFIQYMATKLAKYVFKIYALCDSLTFYTYNLDILWSTGTWSLNNIKQAFWCSKKVDWPNTIYKPKSNN